MSSRKSLFIGICFVICCSVPKVSSASGPLSDKCLAIQGPLSQTPLSQEAAKQTIGETLNAVQDWVTTNCLPFKVGTCAAHLSSTSYADLLSTLRNFIVHLQNLPKLEGRLFEARKRSLIQRLEAWSSFHSDPLELIELWNETYWWHPKTPTVLQSQELPTPFIEAIVAPPQLETFSDQPGQVQTDSPELLLSEQTDSIEEPILSSPALSIETQEVHAEKEETVFVMNESTGIRSIFKKAKKTALDLRYLKLNKKIKRILKNLSSNYAFRANQVLSRIDEFSPCQSRGAFVQWSFWGNKAKTGRDPNETQIAHPTFRDWASVQELNTRIAHLDALRDCLQNIGMSRFKQYLEDETHQSMKAFLQAQDYSFFDSALKPLPPECSLQTQKFFEKIENFKAMKAEWFSAQKSLFETYFEILSQSGQKRMEFRQFQSLGNCYPPLE